MIGYEEVDGVYCPRIYCDWCGLPIEEFGNVYWIVDDDDAVRPGIWHTHKHPCSHLDYHLRYEQGDSAKDVTVMSEELDVHLTHMVRNFTESIRGRHT